jgi:hypothetical protein
MNKLAIFDTAFGAVYTANLSPAAWDLVSFLKNAKVYANTVGGALITLLGLAVVIWAAVLIAKKFFGSNQGQGDSWAKIVVMIIVGGALLAGGITLITTIAKGGKATIEELGGGFILIQHALPLLGLG